MISLKKKILSDFYSDFLLTYSGFDLLFVLPLWVVDAERLEYLNSADCGKPLKTLLWISLNDSLYHLMM